MIVVVCTQAGGPEVLLSADWPEPVPGPTEAVVRLAAANVNPTDLGAREGHYPPGLDIVGPPYILGWDLAGEVTAVGDQVAGCRVGDQVVGMIPWYAAGGRYGTYAELVLLQAQWLVARPDGLDPVTAATVPLNALTARQALARLDAPAGGEILITGASGGVGSFAVQLAVRGGLRVTAQAGTADDDWVASLGAERVLSRDAPVSELGRFSHVLDAVPLGAAVFDAIADGGSVISTRGVPERAGRGIRQAPMLIEQDTAALRELVKAVAVGELRTRVAQTLPLRDAARAHRLTAQAGRHGKVVLTP